MKNGNNPSIRNVLSLTATATIACHHLNQRGQSRFFYVHEHFVLNVWEGPFDMTQTPWGGALLCAQRDGLR